MPDERVFPDINFVDPDLMDVDKTVAAMTTEWEAIREKTLYPADPVSLLIRWATPFIVQDRVLINDSARQNVPRFARSEKLDSLGELFKDVERLPALAAVTTLRFTISQALLVDHPIPIGTRVSTLDGNVVFETAAAGTVTAGNTTADIPAVCQQTGSAGNGFVAGQIATIVDPFPYFASVANLTTSAGGSAEETDAAYYARMRASEDAYTTAGAAGAYEYLAKSVSTDIVDAKADTTTAGTVDVRILMKDGQLPGAETIAQVLAALSADTVRPLTDTVTVAAPDTVSYNIAFTYYIPENAAESPSVIEAKITAAVAAYKAWQSAKMNRDVNPDYLVYLLMQAGAKRLTVTAPVYAAVGEKEVAVFSAETVTNGGVEAE
jgi:phage-related baseplate assembly protein